VIWPSFLICSLAAWPSVERMLFVRMAEATIESANDEKLPELIRGDDEIWPRRSQILEPMRLTIGQDWNTSWGKGVSKRTRILPSILG
jgi:hypothetical protein